MDKIASNLKKLCFKKIDLKDAANNPMTIRRVVEERMTLCDIEDYDKYYRLRAGRCCKDG